MGAMRHTGLKNLLSFVLVLVLTVTAIGFLSNATSASAVTAGERYTQQLRQAQEDAAPAVISAQVAEDAVSGPVSLLAFLLVLAVPAGAVALTRRAKRQGKSAGRQRVISRGDMVLSARVR